MTASPGPLYAAVELGGTHVRCLLADGDGNPVVEDRLATATPEATLGAIERILDGWWARHAVSAIGVASFGPLDLDPASPRFGSILSTPKPGWSGVPLHGRLSEGYRLPVGIDTDVNAAALAEANWGAARGLDTLCYITVGTGVGVGTLIGGQPPQGRGHSEAGHLRIPRVPGDTWPGACPYHGDCVEGLACGKAIELATGQRPEDLPADHPVWERVAHALTALLHNLVLTVVPQRIVIGGGVITGRPGLLEDIRLRLAGSLAGYAHASGLADHLDRFVVRPGLPDRSGLLGALLLAQQAVAAGNARPTEGPAS
jgi:fructokinase